MADDKPKDKPPTSRLGRIARLASLAPRSLPFALEGAKRALSKTPRTEDEEAAAKERMAVEVKKTAEAMLKTLGEMKGLPLKLGQMASYIDGLAPPGHEDKFQAALKKLQDKAPPLSAESAAQMIKTELGAPPEEVFEKWEREPFAAASIGQVHRAVTKSGARVAVKVQYPGIDKAIENDLKSIALLETMIAPLSRKFHAKQALDEIRNVFLSELDYGREAEMADLFRRLNADVPDILIPEVHHSLTTRRVITTSFADGAPYADFCKEGSQEARNRAGEAIWRFTFRSMLRYGVLYADPHPGNYRFLPDGRVWFLDFGCVKMLPPDLVSDMKRYMRAALDNDWVEFDRACIEVLGYDPNDESWDLYRSYTMELMMPLTTKGTWVCSRDKSRETVQYLARGIKSLAFKEGEAIPNIPHVPKMPQDFTFVNRLQWGLASVMAGLGTEASFRNISEGWIRDGVHPIPA
ncbi:AarF/ABC1/UbiB kinase family protein [Polyangium sp. y55x31]|uniref:ABC1 kinase family protein n=1 Tax=Polyangium sp. y55x31 TaxID=3042688 RepID=UPI0024821EA8|nr:AarF/ABC1/UbiB kinase family protein [Polyangium sp. y55x31]MDI1481754.1 AarF/ABC1/UbiB kinase family protein [Polyangium sp. y55x31]